MPRADDLIAAVKTIHAAGLQEGDWPAALGAMTRLLGGGNSATLEVIDKASFRHHVFHSFGIPPVQELTYLKDYAPLNPRLSFHAAKSPGTVLWDYKILDEEAMNRSAFYAEFLRPIGFRYFLSGVLDAPDGQFALVSQQRTRKAGHAGRADIELMEVMLPHVRQALDVSSRIRHVGEMRESLERAFDWLADGVLLVRQDGTVVYANEAMQAIARRDDGIRLKNNHIEFAASEPRDHLAMALASIGRLRTGDVARPRSADFSVSRGSRSRPYVVSVRPLLGGYGRPYGGAVAIVFVRDPASRHAAAISILRAALGLTEAEAHLAQALQAGTTLGAYARAHAVSVNTVYTHLRSMKDKTGCRRLPELISTLNDLRVPLRPVQ
jgi:DNA-binding CsgD family transcriptional regulator/PAS domain-containing protein